MKRQHLYPLVLLWAALSVSGPSWGIVYCNITDVRVDVLTNGVQVTIQADGALDYEHAEERWQVREWYGKNLPLLFPGARSKVGRNFIDVSKFPLSYLQLSIPPDAKEGVGVLLDVVAMTRTAFEVTRAADRQSLIITVASTRTLERGEAGEEVEAGKARLEITVHDGTGSVYAVNADVHEVFARLARDLNVDVVVDDGVERTVSTYLVDAPAEELMRNVARAAGLAMVKADDGSYMIGEGVVQDLATYRLTETRSFRLRNTAASEAAQLLPTFIFPYLNQNTPQNAVVVTAQEDMLRKIEQDLKTIDVAPPQIMIEVLAVEFVDTKDIERVLSLTHQDADRVGAYNAGTGDITFSTVGALPADFQVKLQWLKSKGKAVVKAEPRMAVLNGNAATIFIGTTRFFEIEVTEYGGVSKRIQGVNVGVTLRVTPWTGEGEEITTTVVPTVSNVSELDPETGLPVLSTRDARTQVRTRKGETIIIGGLTLEQEESVTHKTPILGDIPLIGQLFRRRAKEKTTSELVIFVTPRVLDESGHLPDAEEEQSIRQRFLEQEGWQEPRTIRTTLDDLRAGRIERE